MQRTKQRSIQEWKSVQGSLREREGRVVYMNELCMAERKGGRGGSPSQANDGGTLN